MPQRVRQRLGADPVQALHVGPEPAEFDLGDPARVLRHRVHELRRGIELGVQLEITRLEERLRTLGAT